MGERSSVKCLGLKAGGSFPPHPLPTPSPFLLTPSLLLPNFLAHPRRVPLLARFSFACSISARPEKGKESAATQATFFASCNTRLAIFIGTQKVWPLSMYMAVTNSVTHLWRAIYHKSVLASGNNGRRSCLCAFNDLFHFCLYNFPGLVVALSKSESQCANVQGF